MPDSLESTFHVRPFVYESPRSKALHFSIGEIQSRMQLKDPCALDLEYTRTMMGFLLFRPDPVSIAMIGLGGGSLAKFCHRYLPRARLQAVEINPHVIALRNEFHVPPDDERFSVVRADGAQFVRHRPSRFDVLLVDGYDSDGLPARLSSQRFYDDCRASLQPGGIVVVNLHYGHAGYDAQVDRLRRSFDDAVLVVDDRELSNSVAFAGNGQALSAQGLERAMRPTGLDAAAADQLRSAFARVAGAAMATTRSPWNSRPHA